MGTRGTPLRVEDSDQIVPPTSRKVFVALDERGLRIGETHPNAHLTDAQVNQMRDLRENEGWTLYRLAEHFAVPYPTVTKICNYERRATSIARWKVILLQTPPTTTKED